MSPIGIESLIIMPRDGLGTKVERIRAVIKLRSPGALRESVEHELRVVCEGADEMPPGAGLAGRRMWDGMSAETANCTVCGQPLGEDGRCLHCDASGHVWTIQDWRPLLTLSLVIVLGFSFTRLVVTQYDEKRQALAAEYYAAGLRAMDAQKPAEAVDALENALIYSHDNFQYQLKLTDALLASGATSEAVAQLHSFLEQRPGDAQVYLKLARLEARRHHVDEALRYYLDAIEGDVAGAHRSVSAAHRGAL